MESDTNVGLGMVPHKKACRCLECENERHEAEIKDLKSKLASCEKELAEAREDIGILDTSVDQQILEYRAECENSGRKDVLLQELQSRLDSAVKVCTERHTDTAVLAATENELRTVCHENNLLRSRLDKATMELAINEQRFQAAREAWDVLFDPPPAQPDSERIAGHQRLVDAISGVKFMQPDEATIAWARDVIQEMAVERQRSIGPCPVCRSNDTILDATAPPSRLMRCRACSSEWSASA